MTLRTCAANTTRHSKQTHNSKHQTAQEVQLQLERARDDVEVKRNISGREKEWLERRLEESENVAKMVRTGSREAYNQQHDLMNLNYKLKRDNLKLARSKMSAKEIEEYLG